MAVVLAAGILAHSPSSGAVAAGAALTVGFAAFKHLRGSTALAMLLVSAGVSLSAAAGTLAGRSDAAMIVAVLLWSVVAGLLPAAPGSLGWIAQRCTIFLVVAGNFPGDAGDAATRAGLVLGGSVLQLLAVTGAQHLAGVRRPPPPAETLAEAGRRTGAAIVRAVRERSDTFRRAVRLGVVLAAAAQTWRSFHLPNGYWVPMTALMLVQPGVRATLQRGAERVAGTVAGVAMATLLTDVLPRATAHPSAPWLSAGLVAAFAVLTLALQSGHHVGRRALTYPGSYVVFAACLTAYIVFLLQYGGMQGRGVAVARVLFTALGAVFAVAVDWPVFGGSRPARATPAPAPARRPGQTASTRGRARGATR